jgi:hypothetical protein
MDSRGAVTQFVLHPRRIIDPVCFTQWMNCIWSEYHGFSLLIQPLNSTIIFPTEEFRLNAMALNFVVIVIPTLLCPAYVSDKRLDTTVSPFAM